MKNLTTEHFSIKQSIQSHLVNCQNDNQEYTNVKISLLNNAIVFPLPIDFRLENFNTAISDYLNNELKTETQLQLIGDDIYSLPFSPIGLGIMKKVVVYFITDQHLYINILPLKEIANANYTENAISGFLTSGKSDKIYEFVENHIMSYYPDEVRKTTQPNGRYFFTTSIGLSIILANHLEDGEKILAKLDIHKIEQSKSNIQTSDSDEAFYLCTTHGSYLMVLDDNLQEKYVETLTDCEMKTQSKFGRDLSTCGNTQWLCNRDNDKLFHEVSPLNNLNINDKLIGFALLQFNNCRDNDGKMYASELLRQYATIDKQPFSTFAHSLIEFSTKLSDKTSEQYQTAAQELMESANSLLSETEFEQKLQHFLTDFKFSSQELSAVIFTISRVRNRISDTELFGKIMKMLKESYFQVDSDSLNRGFICLSIAKKLNMIGQREIAFELAEEANNLIGYNYSLELAPGMDTTPESPFAADALSYSAIEELFKASITDKYRFDFAHQLAVMKPLIKSNIANLTKYSSNNQLTLRLNEINTLFDSQNFNNYVATSESPFETKFSKISDSIYMPQCTKWRKPFSNFMSWVQKIQPDKSFGSVIAHGTLLDSSNYLPLNELNEKLKKYFELENVEIYLFKNREQGIISNDDGNLKYIFIDEELLDINNPNYMNTHEMSFALAREYAALKLGLNRLTCRPQWRAYSTKGVSNIDIISSYAPETSFISSELESYTRQQKFAQLLSRPEYFDFDISDTKLASQFLSQTIDTIAYQGDKEIDNLKELEYAALVQLTTMILDRIAILATGNVVSAIKSILHSENANIKGGVEFLTDKTVIDLSIGRGADNKPVNYDFAMRINSLVSFYISDDYKKY